MSRLTEPFPLGRAGLRLGLRGRLPVRRCAPPRGLSFSRPSAVLNNMSRKRLLPLAHCSVLDPTNGTLRMRYVTAGDARNLRSDATLLVGLLQSRLPARLIVRRGTEPDPGDAAADGKIETLRVQADRPPSLPAGFLMAGQARDEVVAERVDPVDEPRLRLGQRRLAFARDQDIGGRQRLCPAEAAVEMDAFDRQPEKREIREVGVELRLGVALQVADADPRLRRALELGRSA